MCGEQLLQLAEDGLAPGSPPRVRGTADVDTFELPEFRITPACAGNRGGRQRFYHF